MDYKTFRNGRPFYWVVVVYTIVSICFILTAIAGVLFLGWT
jgi:hypothetical protein